MALGFRFGPLYGLDSVARVAAQSAESAAHDARGDVDLMRGEIERLLMITEALWTMMKKSHGRTDDELIAEIAKIDMRDGRIDGRVGIKSVPLACPGCGRTLSRQRPACIYCGTPVALDPFAR